MSVPQFPNSPQAFNFQAQDLSGYVTAWSGKANREFAQHRFPKRAGARIEDMERAPRWIEARMIWTGKDCASKYEEFKQAVDQDPYGLLIHPLGERYNAFCQGPNEAVDFVRSIDEIQVTVAWIETELDQAVAADTPDVATAVQNASGALVKAETTTATQTSKWAKALTSAKRALAKIDGAIAQAEAGLLTVDQAALALGQISGILSSTLGLIDQVQVRWDVLKNAANNFINASSDLFSGSDVAPGGSTSTDTLMGQVTAAAQAAQDTLIAVSPTPAGAADACGDIDELVAACLVVVDALKKARPPVVLWTNPTLSDVLSIAVRKYPKNNPQARAQDIMALNRIPNPAAVPAGMRLLVPSR